MEPFGAALLEGSLQHPYPAACRKGSTARMLLLPGVPLIPRVCLREQCLWLEHKHQNVIGPLSATYLGPFGTYSASKNSLAEKKNTFLK